MSMASGLASMGTPRRPYRSSVGIVGRGGMGDAIVVAAGTAARYARAVGGRRRDRTGGAARELHEAGAGGGRGGQGEGPGSGIRRVTNGERPEHPGEDQQQPVGRE